MKNFLLIISKLVLFVFFILISFQVIAFGEKTKNSRWYFSWGYNKDYWSDSDIRVSQPELNNHFTVYDVAASDSPGWDTGIFNKDLMVPQYNLRIGYFLDPNQTWAIEFSFDHTKYNTNLNQTAYVSGIIDGQSIEENKVLTSTYFNYLLHNGANNVMLNLVKRNPLFMIPHSTMRVVAISKLGAGLMLPHPESTILGNKSDVGPKAWGNLFGWNKGWWQVGGWTAGIEFGFQVVFRNTLYLELTDKEAYNSLSDIQVYKGTASQTMWLNELILNLGVMI